MKKWMLWLACVPLVASAAFAQESRQDASVSGVGLYQTAVSGNDVQESRSVGEGILASYRYMLTPRSALEANYGYNFNVERFKSPINYVKVDEHLQEVSAAYVRSFTFRNLNPFLEAGVGGYLFQPINNETTNYSGASGGPKQNTQIGFLFGGGIAYELSPSFDIRVQYRGVYVKAPSFSLPEDITRTNRYTNISEPVIGVAYHF